MKLNYELLKELEKTTHEKVTENGDKSFTSTGNDLIDLLFMAEYFTANLDEVKLGNSANEKLFSMYMRDPIDGKGYRDLGRELMKQSSVHPEDVTLVGRFDDLWKNPTPENIKYLAKSLQRGDALAKKWMPRLQSKDKKVAKTLAKVMNLNERQYRVLIKAPETVEYKLSYTEQKEGTPLDELFEKNVHHPLVDDINFEHVPSLAMTKYLNLFSTREDLKDRFNDYIEEVKEGKSKVNTKTANVRDAMKASSANDVVAKKIVEQETKGLSLNAIVVQDTSGSMTWGRIDGIGVPYDNAMAVAHAIATNSTYAKNQVISFSSRPQLIDIKGNTLQEQYRSMHTGDASNTDLAAVFELLKGLKTYPEYMIILSDMEFDYGSNTSMEEYKELLKEHGADTKLIWWNFNQRNRTSPEFNSDGSIFMSGYNVSSLMLLPGVMDMDEYLEDLLQDYKRKLFKRV